MKSIIIPFALIGPAAAQMQMPMPMQLYSSYSFEPLKHLAGIAPYFEPGQPPLDPNPPQGCSVTRAAYLVRHAAINANDFDSESYIDPFLYKLGNNTNIDWSTVPALAFLSTWQAPTIGEQEQLTRTGRLEAAQLGVSISYRYPSLRTPKHVWASTANRTVDSAKALIRAFEMDKGDISLVQVKEGKKQGADSLTPYSNCAAYLEDAGEDEQNAYIKSYTAPIMARLNALAPQFNFSAEDVVGMQELCGYDTVIRGSSPFCSTDLFSPDEWLQFEYGQDLHYHYTVGYGSDASGVIGFPWLNESLSLIGADQADEDLYISFTHREMPPTVLVALGMFNNSAFGGGGSGSNINETMPSDQVNYNRVWQSSRILPFLTNIAIERMNCSSNYAVAASTNSSSNSSSSNSTSSDPSTFYRVLVNRSPQVIPGCIDGPGQSCSASGMSSFLAQRTDMFGGYSQRCGNTYSNSTDYVSFYTQSADNATTMRR